MSEKDDGGSAFPQVESAYDHSAHEYTGNIYSTGGMTLRDYFAASALQGRQAFTAREAYAIADAMLAERTK